MHTSTPLPAYSAEELQRLDPRGLTSLMVADEDRVPRNVIEECARRGDEMADHLGRLLLGDEAWAEDMPVGEWWLYLHAAMILGRIPSERAGLLLVDLMRRMSAEGDESPEDWLSGYWPALFANKPETVLPALRALGEDQSMDWFIRTSAIDAVVATADRQGGAALEAALDWLAGIAADEDEDWDVRPAAGNTLLSFPRPQDRELLDDLASEQVGWIAYFSRKDVSQAFEGAPLEKEWERFADPWEFYDPQAIADRQARWAKDAEEEKERARRLLDVERYGLPAMPHIRETPKVGRNDPCPCGSGKKYKKCCLGKNA